MKINDFEIGTVPQSGMYTRSEDFIGYHYPLLGEIIKIRLKYQDEKTTKNKTPVIPTYDIKTEYGIKKHVPVCWPYRGMEVPYEIGDHVVIGFVKGKSEGAFIMGYLNLPNQQITRDIPDKEFFKDSLGNTTRVDENGNRIQKKVGNDIQFVVKDV